MCREKKLSRIYEWVNTKIKEPQTEKCGLSIRLYDCPCVKPIAEIYKTKFIRI